MTLHHLDLYGPALATDSINGIATFRAVLPEDLARWRITARAFDREGRKRDYYAES